MTGDGSNTDVRLDVALWYKRLKETSNERFLPLFFDRRRFLVLKGGGGSGKSIFAGRKVLERCASEPGHRFLVVRKVGRTLRESCFEQLKAQAYEHYADEVAFIPRGKGSDMYIRFVNGSEIIFSGLDDVEKLKSIFDITGMWIEEASEISEADFNQLDIRLRTETPYYLQMILTFNPISITHWLKKRFFDTRDERACVHESTYKDNRFLIPEARATLEAFRETDEYYYTVYCLGEWGVTGKTVFDGKAVTARLLEVRAAGMPRHGCFAFASLGENGAEETALRKIDDASIRFEDGADIIRIYREPVKGRPYVIGGDTAGDGSDYFAAHVLDNVTGEQVAVLHHRYDEDTFTQQIYCLGRYYNDALIGIETNFSTFPVKMLQMLGYKRQYVREVEDTFEAKIRKAYGFRTDGITRPVIISELVRIMRTGVGTIRDDRTLEEMLTFVRNEKLRPEAEEGAHDDLVMSLAIAFYIRSQQDTEVEQAEEERVEWTDDMWEDYMNADEEGRLYLMKKWGMPK